MTPERRTEIAKAEEADAPAKKRGPYQKLEKAEA